MTIDMLELKNVHTYYGNIHALKGISIVVNEGEIVTLIGSNGAGKTTTLRTIQGLLRPREGSITLRGEELTKIPPHEIVQRGISQSPEGRLIFAGMTVRENLEMGAYQRRDKDGITGDMEHVFALFPRLKDRQTQLAGSLSGGEQQMLAIGRAMMAGPRLLLLDEPSLGLAPRLAAEILETLGRLNREGLGILLVEQRAPLALKLARRAYLLAVGRVVAEVTPDQIASPHDLARYYFAAA